MRNKTNTFLQSNWEKMYFYLFSVANIQNKRTKIKDITLILTLYNYNAVPSRFLQKYVHNNKSRFCNSDSVSFLARLVWVGLSHNQINNNKQSILILHSEKELRRGSHPHHLSNARNVFTYSKHVYCKSVLRYFLVSLLSVSSCLAEYLTVHQ